jgi:type II secretory pathway pseudopilin PulG
LIESLFAIFLVVVVAAIIAATLPLANSSRARADLLNKATSIAQKQIENLRSVGYPNLSGNQLFAAGLIQSAIPDANGRFVFTNIDSAVFDAPSNVLPQGVGYITIQQLGQDRRRVTVRVEWTERDRTRDVTLSTLIANL